MQIDKLTDQNAAKFLKWTAMGLWAVSLFRPVFSYANPPGPQDFFPGYAMLAIGWMGVAALQLAWIGNVFLPITLFTRKWASWFTLFALISAYNWHEWYDDAGTFPITAYGSGYYLWLVAMLLASIPLLFPLATKRRMAIEDHPRYEEWRKALDNARAAKDRLAALDSLPIDNPGRVTAFDECQEAQTRSEEIAAALFPK